MVSKTTKSFFVASNFMSIPGYKNARVYVAEIIIRVNKFITYDD